MAKVALRLVEPAAAIKNKKPEGIKITPPNFLYASVAIRGTAPFVSNNMSQRNIENMKAAQLEGTQVRRAKRKRPPKDFQAAFKGAQHISTQGWKGIPCAAFRAAMISACRTVDFTMARAKLSLFVEPDGYDKDSHQPLVRIYGEPHPFDMPVRLASGATDLACRPMWDDWSCTVRIKFDADSFTASDVVNLLARAGAHCGVGAGRPDSKESSGVGWGTFEIEGISNHKPNHKPRNAAVRAKQRAGVKA